MYMRLTGCRLIAITDIRFRRRKDEFMKKLFLIVLVLTFISLLYGCSQSPPEIRILEDTYKKMMRANNFSYTSEVTYDDSTITHYFSVSNNVIQYYYEYASQAYHSNDIRNQYISYKGTVETVYTSRYNGYFYDNRYFVNDATTAERAFYREVRDKTFLHILNEHDRISSIEEDTTSWTYVFDLIDYDIERVKTVANRIKMNNYSPIEKIEISFRINKDTKRVETISSNFEVRAGKRVILLITFADFGKIRLTLPNNLVN